MGRQLDAVEECVPGVEAFYQARAQFEGKSAYLGEEASMQEAADLSYKGPTGVYYDVIGTDNRSYTVRLCHSGGKFYLGGGTLEYLDFLRLQELFKHELEASQLPFHQMLSEQHERHIGCPAATLAAQPA